MQKLNILVYNNDKIEQNKTNISYNEKLNTLYFSFNKTKYYFNYEKRKLKYKTDEQEVTLDFLNNLAQIKLKDYKDKLYLHIKTLNYINESKYFLIDYLIEDDNIKRTIKITLL